MNLEVFNSSNEVEPNAIMGADMRVKHDFRQAERRAVVSDAESKARLAKKTMEVKEAVERLEAFNENAKRFNHIADEIRGQMQAQVDSLRLSMVFIRQDEDAKKLADASTKEHVRKAG